MGRREDLDPDHMKVVEMRFNSELYKRGIKLADGDSRSEILEDRNTLRRLQNTLQEEAEAQIKHNATDSELKGTLDLMTFVGSCIKKCSDHLDMLDRVSATYGTNAPFGSGDQWRDPQGRVVPVLRNTDSFASLVNGSERAQTFGFGQYVAAMVSGTNVPEIRNSLSEGTDSAGGHTVPTRLTAQIIDMMRARTVAIQAGAMTVPLDTKVTKIARLASDPSASWRLELGSVATADPTFEAVQFTAQSLAVIVKISRELLEDSLNIDSALSQAFAGAMAVELDRVALFGSGTAPEPRGVANTSGINSVPMGANGAAITTYAPLLDAIYELEVDNAVGNAWVMHPRTSRTLNGLVDTTGQPLRAPEAVAALRRWVSTNVPITQTQGTSNVASTVLAGDWSQLMIGIRSDMRIEVLRELYAGTHEYGFVCHMRADIAVARPKAFCKVIGITP